MPVCVEDQLPVTGSRWIGRATWVLALLMLLVPVALMPVMEWGVVMGPVSFFGSVDRPDSVWPYKAGPEHANRVIYESRLPENRVRRVWADHSVGVIRVRNWIWALTWEW